MVGKNTDNHIKRRIIWHENVISKMFLPQKSIASTMVFL